MSFVFAFDMQDAKNHNIIVFNAVKNLIRKTMKNNSTKGFVI